MTKMSKLLFLHSVSIIWALFWIMFWTKILLLNLISLNLKFKLKIVYFPCLKIKLNRRLFVCLPCCCLRAELAVNPGLQCQSRELDNCTIHSTLLPCLWYMKQHFLSIGLIQAANKVSFKMYLAKQIHITLCKCSYLENQWNQWKS